MKKTIVFVIDDFHLGGLASFVHTYSEYSHSRGYNTIILGETGDSLRDKKYFPHSTVIPLPLSPFTERHDNVFTYMYYRLHFILKFARAYQSIRKSIHIDAIHFNLTWGPLSLLLCNPSVYSIPKIITFYGDFALEHKSRVGYVAGIDRLRTDIKVLFLTVIQWLTLVLSDHIIVFSRYSLLHLERRFHIKKKKMTIIPGTIDLTEYPEYRKTSGRNSGITKLINISRFENRKGHDILLYAVADLLKHKHKVHLTIRGPISGEILPILKIYEEEHLSQDVTILYSASIRERLSLLRTSDLFVMPSREYETFGLTMVEALACGIPVVGTPVGAIPEVLSLVDRRLIAKSISSGDLARTISWFIRLNAKEKNVLRRRSRYVARTFFASDIVLPRLEKLYGIVAS